MVSAKIGGGKKSNMAAMEVRPLGLCEAKFRTEHSGVGTSLKAPGLVVRPRAVTASEVQDGGGLGASLSRSQHGGLGVGSRRP